MFIDYYKVLGISKSATPAEIRSVYRELAKKYHPDKHRGNPGFEEKFKHISEAYHVLSNQERRKKYDDRYEYYEFTGSQNTTVWHESGSSTPPTGRRKRSPYYATKKREFTPFAWMLGKIFIFSLAMAIILIPLFLIRWASKVQYNKGLEYEAEGQYQDAVRSYKNSHRRFGALNLESCLKVGDLSYHRLNRFDDAEFYYTLAFNYTSNDSLAGSLHYQIAKAQGSMGKYENALYSLDSASMYHFNRDSIEDLKSQIYTFGLKDYPNGKDSYSYLVNREFKLFNSLIGLGLCNFQLNLLPQAVENFTDALEIDSTFARVYFQRGTVFYYMNDSIASCQDFLKAKNLGSSTGVNAFEMFCTVKADSIESSGEQKTE